MSRLEVNDILHQRGEDGKLLPLEVELESLRTYDTIEDEKKRKRQVVKEKGPTVVITPMSRGELKTLFNDAKVSRSSQDKLETTKDQDDMILKNHLIDPKIPEEKLKDLKPAYAGAIVIAVMAISLEITQKTMEQAGRESVKKLADKIEGDISKN